MDRDRRTFLGAVGAAGVVLLAGCSEFLEEEPSPSTTGFTPTGTDAQTHEPTETPTEEPLPTYVQFTPTINQELRRQVPQEQIEFLESTSFTEDSILYTDPAEVVDDEIAVQEVPIDPIGMMAFHYNDLQDAKSHDPYMPELEVFAKAALGKEDQLDPEHQEAVRRAKEEPNNMDYPNSPNIIGKDGHWDESKALNATSLDQHLDWTIPLHANLEDEIDEGMSSVEDAKQAAGLGYVARVGAGIHAHIFPFKIGQGEHGFIGAHDWDNNFLLGVETGMTGVVEGLHQPIEEIHYEGQQFETWTWEPGDPTGYVVPMAAKMVTNFYGDELPQGTMSSVGVHPEYKDTVTDILAQYNQNPDTEFKDALHLSIGMVKLMRHGGMYGLDFTEGQPYGRALDSQAAVESVRHGTPIEELPARGW